MSRQPSHTGQRLTPCREAAAYLIRLSLAGRPLISRPLLDRPLLGIRAEKHLDLPALGGRNG
jgi:hypothetical protein